MALFEDETLEQYSESEAPIRRACLFCKKVITKLYSGQKICQKCQRIKRDILLNRKQLEIKNGKTHKCDACGATTRSKLSHIDHNHESGEVRGRLCVGCNLALGNAGDNPRILEALAAYLRRTSCAATRPLIH